MLELSRQECLGVLASHRFGRVAVSLGTGPPVIRPVNYLFDVHSQSILFRTAGGSKFHALMRSTEAAFEVDGIDEASRTGWSVILHGLAEEVTLPAEIRRLERLGVEPWAPGAKCHWLRIRAGALSGRRILLGRGLPPGHFLG